jgi:hypothetical protein
MKRFATSIREYFTQAAQDFGTVCNPANLSQSFEQQTLIATSYAASKAFKGINFLRKNFPGKTCGALALPGSTAIAIQGLGTGDKSIIAAGLTLLASNLALIFFSDLKNSHKKDPQDKKFKFLNTVDPVHHPHEFSCAFEAAALTCLIYGGLNAKGGEELGYTLMGLTDVPGMLITIFVREKNIAHDHRYRFKPLNIPGIRQTAHFVQKQPLLASVPFYVAGDLALYGFNLMQAGFDPGKVDPAFTVNFISYNASTFFLLFAKKRRMTANDNNLAEKPSPQALPSGP